MNYIERLKAITTVEELFKLREELKIIADTLSETKETEKCQEAYFYLNRATTQIEYLEARGLFLNSLKIDNVEKENNNNV